LLAAADAEALPYLWTMTQRGEVAAMVDRGVLHRIRRQRDLTAYHRRLTADIGRWPALHALPQLLSVALPIANAHGALTPLRTTLAQHRFITLAGQPGAGRGLAMQQLALYHTRRADPAGPLPALLELPQIDDGHSPPAQLLDAALNAPIREPAPNQARRLWNALANGAFSEHSNDWLLFVHGWETLPDVRRAVWRETLAALAARETELRVVVAVPPGEQWKGFHPLVITAPTPHIVARWVEQLCQPPERAAVGRALGPDGALAECTGRLFDIALLCWLAPRAGVPAGRTELYEHALAAVRAEPERYASQRHTPLGHAQLGRFALAQRVVAERRFELLATLPAPDLAETAAFAAALVPDTTPLLNTLWRLGATRADATIALGRCVVARMPASPVWVLRAATCLAVLTPGSDQYAEAQSQLQALLPALDTCLAQLAGRTRPATRLLTRLLAALPAELALPRAEQLVFGESSCKRQAWALADVLATRYTTADRVPSLPTDVARRVRWVYVSIMANRADVITAGDVRTLGTSGAGPVRCAAAAAAVAQNRALAEDVRLAGIELLVRDAGPAQRLLVAQLCDDPVAAVRKAAQAALARLDPQAAQRVWTTAAAHGSTWEQRLEALLRLGERPEVDASTLLARHARDERLPLAARLRLVAVLGRRVRTATLHALAADATCVEMVRAAAARAAARASNDGVVMALQNAEIPNWLALSICEGVVQRPRAVDPRCEQALLRRLHMALGACDLALAHAVLGALGVVAGEAGAAVLAELLAPATLDERLVRSNAALLDQPPEACLADRQLPAGLRHALATAVARGLTLADTPSTLREFLASEVDRLRASAARALGMTGGAQAADSLRSALRYGASQASAACVAALGELEGLETLAELLGTPWLPQGVRWQVVQHIARGIAGDIVLRAALDQPGLDAFTRGALVEALGRRGAHSALLAITRILRDPSSEAHVREQAATALGLMDEPPAEPALLRVFADPACPLELRGHAAGCLPRALGDDARQRLRDTLRGERVPGPLLVGALGALGRARDRETLTLAMRYALDDRADVVRAALGALADIGDETVTPVLARAAQSAKADHVSRIQAIGALLRLGGGEHRLLLQPYLDHSSPLLQLRALDVLIEAGAAPHELMRLATERGRALPLRLRALEQAAGAPEVSAELLALAASEGDDQQIRLRAIIALGNQRYAPAVATLATIAHGNGSSPALCYRAVEALGRIGGTEALDILSTIVEDEATDPAAGAWAATALHAAGETLG
jgi:HEAT repeat protein